ncbi:hypothetical protein A5766_00005 [Gordonia sp. 852002-51296_SCH5728562-b]|nr:hypothetical protein A5766_00005 [Gordonia sp. 852002-51296_SCH5728562-b]
MTHLLEAVAAQEKMYHYRDREQLLQTYPVSPLFSSLIKTPRLPPGLLLFQAAGVPAVAAARSSSHAVTSSMRYKTEPPSLVLMYGGPMPRMRQFFNVPVERSRLRPSVFGDIVSCLWSFIPVLS